MTTVNRKLVSAEPGTLQAHLERDLVSPPVDVFESEREIVLEAEMPGVPKDGTRLSIEGDELTLSGEAAGTDVPSGYAAVYTERRPREYRRVFVLGAEVQRDKIRARYEDGVLQVTLPKAERAQPRRIPVE